MESGQYVDEELRSRLHTLATDFPRLWRDPNTPDRERKRLAHLLLEDVTLIKREQLLIHIRFPGGATRTLELPRPRRATVTQRSVIAEVDRLLDEHSHEAIANILNSRGSVSGYGKAFTGRMIGRVRVNRLGSKCRGHFALPGTAHAPQRLPLLFFAQHFLDIVETLLSGIPHCSTLGVVLCCPWGCDAQC
jgi:hypothetical protein